MEKLSDSRISECLETYGVLPTRLQCDQVRAYIALLLKWNRSISLTTVTEEAEVLKFHFGESVLGLRAVSGIENGRLADVGAGAGFPGVPLRIFASHLQLVLIESNVKKCAFLSEVVRELGLENVRVIRGRFEHVSDFRNDLDTIVARALGDYDELLKWAKNSLASTGKIALWIGERDAGEIAKIESTWSWCAPVQILGSAKRVILSGSPKSRR